MSVVYIVSHNGQLKRENEVLYYSDYTGNVTKILPNKVDQIVVVGNLEISGQALNLMMVNHIAVNFLSKNGFFNGKIVYHDSKNALLRHRQHQCYDNEDFTICLARDIVKGKIHNELLFLQRLERKIGKNAVVSESLQAISHVRTGLDHASFLDEIRGYEGIAAKNYFSCFGLAIDSKEFKFGGRTKNPPKDEINSVLSFLYTVLANRIDKYISLEGLDSSVGSLHALTYGRKSLVFDLIEEFRTPIADTLTCAIFNLGVLSKEDFRKEMITAADEEASIPEQLAEDEQMGVLLTEDGMRKVLQQFERKIGTEHKYPQKDRILTYDAILREQVKQYKQVIAGIIDHYMPLVVT